MSDVKRIRAPFDEATARSLRAGDRVLITGTIIAARDVGMQVLKTLEPSVELKSTTTPYGRTAERNGNPIRICEMLSTLDGPSFIARVSVHDVKNVLNARKVIAKAFEHQAEGKGLSLVEVLSTCPTNWGRSPQEAMKFVAERMIPEYPLGIFKEV